MLYLIDPGWVKNRRWCNLRILTWQLVLVDPEKTDDISQRNQRFAGEMTSEKQVQKFHFNNASLLRSGYCFWLVVPRVRFASTNQKHSPDLGRHKFHQYEISALFLRRHFAGKPLVASRNVVFFLRLVLVEGRFFMVEGTDTFPRFINEYRCGDLIARTERKKEQLNIFDYI